MDLLQQQLSPEPKPKKSQGKSDRLPRVYMLLGYRGEQRVAMASKICLEYGAIRINLAGIIFEERNNPKSPFQSMLKLFQSMQTTIPDNLACKLILKKVLELQRLRYVIEDYPGEPLCRLTGVSSILAPKVDVEIVLSPLHLNISNIPGAKDLTTAQISKLIRKTVINYMSDIDVDVFYHLNDDFIEGIVTSSKSYEEIFVKVRHAHRQLLSHQWNFKQR